MIMFAMFVGVLVTLFIGVTTAGSMAFISIATYIGMGEATLNNMIRLPSSMYDQVKGITLMAIPFFLLMGNFMNRGGVSKDLFAFARACLGHRWGGLANAAIASWAPPSVWGWRTSGVSWPPCIRAICHDSER